MRRLSRTFILAIALSALASCAGNEKPDTRPIASDPVCLYNRDLGCIRVRVDDKTPRAEYAGTTYYFCGEGCRDAFLKEPAKYLPAKTEG